MEIFGSFFNTELLFLHTLQDFLGRELALTGHEFAVSSMTAPHPGISASKIQSLGSF